MVRNDEIYLSRERLRMVLGISATRSFMLGRDPTYIYLYASTSMGCVPIFSSTNRNK